MKGEEPCLYLPIFRLLTEARVSLRSHRLSIANWKNLFCIAYKSVAGRFHFQST